MHAMSNTLRGLLLLTGIILVACLPWWVEGYYVSLAIKIMIYAIDKREETKRGLNKNITDNNSII